MAPAPASVLAINGGSSGIKFAAYRAGVSGTEPNRAPKIYFIRHAETAWTIRGQHTGRSGIPLTAPGERDVQELSDRGARLSPTC